MRTVSGCCLWWVLFLALVSSAAAETSTGLTAGDATAVRAVLERYRTTWLANDENGVLSTFARDAILLPAHGGAPVSGTTAIKEYWWPASTTKTTITKFVQTLDEVGGNSELAYARGTSDVEWSTEDKGTTQRWQNGSSFMFLLKRQTDGTWLISHLIWDAGENKLLK
jgi:uncharacterized protein (TIGR02246 family)